MNEIVIPGDGIENGIWLECGCWIKWIEHYDEFLFQYCPLHAAAGQMKAALEDFMECPYYLDQASIPKAGIDAAPQQVVGNMSVAWLKVVAARAAIAAAREKVK